MSNPWLKFYPSDWQSDPALRSCSGAARGLWVEMLCFMHQAEPRGALLINGKPINAKILAGLSNLPAKEVSASLAELEEAGVFSRTDDDVIFSRRMMRDETKALADKANGARGGNPKLRRGGLTPSGSTGDKAQKLEARSQTPDRKDPSHDEKFSGVEVRALALVYDEDNPFGAERAAS